jgi:hypothetical protein
MEQLALQVLLAQKIEQTSEDSVIFRDYVERNLYERIMLKLCRFVNLSEDEVEAKLRDLPILAAEVNARKKQGDVS